MYRRRLASPSIRWWPLRSHWLFMVGLLVMPWSQAAAIPSFARQTGFAQIPSDLVVDRWALSVGSRSSLDFLCIPDT
jgi:hypothetical protein